MREKITKLPKRLMWIGDDDDFRFFVLSMETQVLDNGKIRYIVWYPHHHRNVPDAYEIVDSYVGFDDAVEKMLRKLNDDDNWESF